MERYRLAILLFMIPDLFFHYLMELLWKYLCEFSTIKIIRLELRQEVSDTNMIKAGYYETGKNCNYGLGWRNRKPQ